MELNGRPIRVLDLFAGAGGLTLGLESAEIAGMPRFEAVALVDRDPNACETLRTYLRRTGRDDTRVIQADLTMEKDRHRIIDLCSRIGGVDVIAGGPPCQSFSMIGPRSGYGTHDDRWKNDNRDSLYRHYLNLVRRLEPSLILFENVRGLLSKRNPDGELFADIITRDLEKCRGEVSNRALNYTLHFENKQDDRHIVLNAANYGVPQIRHRVFFIGNRFGIPNRMPEQTHYDPDNPPDESKGMLPWVTIREAIGDLPRVRAPYTMTRLTESEKTHHRKINKQRYTGKECVSYHWEEFESHYNRSSTQGREFLDWVRPRDRDTELLGHVARGQQRDDQELFAGMAQGETSADLLRRNDPLLEYIKYDMSSFKDKYRKQSWDRPSTTIFAHLVKDGNRFIHPDSDQARTLTVREAARLQSFPDHYEIRATGLRRFIHIGNAVPPLLAKTLGESMLHTLQAALQQDLVASS